ncbi:hypothetical protein Tco_0747655 [Tanacetum coccineum]|uniref:Retrotransposon gag domain-containing protein n=1 Tax=Tanacetum coccineum TaxID=301880 RepID=A0ABQ4YTD6_9ASTR
MAYRSSDTVANFNFRILFILNHERKVEESNDGMMKSITEEYVTKARDDYYSGITKTMINGKNAYELKGKFLDDLQNNAFSGTNREDAVKHVENFLKIVDALVLPNVSYEQLRLAVFPISVSGEASKWLKEEPQCSITTWEDLTERFFGKYYPPSCTGRMTESKAK